VVEESKTEQFEKFNDLIIISVKTDQAETTIAGTVFSDGTGRVVLYDKFRLDIVPEGTFLHFRIMDRPGIIGRVATILGENKINIAGFGLSRQVSGVEIAFVSVDDMIDNDVLAKIQAIDGMIEASVIQL
jgi:D-3-phosphoglycerate dehydrogenase